jgi:tRNA nucleotidyltransferase (CCA-adding enzyme)
VELGLYSSIFHIPATVAPTLSSPPHAPELGLAASNVLHALTSPSYPAGLPSLCPILASAAAHEPSTRPRLFLASALTPYRSITYEDAKRRTHLAVEAALREGTKLGVQNHYLDGIPALFNAAELLQKPEVVIGKENERIKMGKCDGECVFRGRC